MEVPSGVNDSQRVMELCRLIAFLFYIVEKVLEVVVRDRELVQQAVLLEDLHTEMEEGLISEHLLVFEDIKVPLVKVVHDFNSLIPNSL